MIRKEKLVSPSFSVDGNSIFKEDWNGMKPSKAKRRVPGWMTGVLIIAALTLVMAACGKSGGDNSASTGGNNSKTAESGTTGAGGSGGTSNAGGSGGTGGSGADAKVKLNFLAHSNYEAGLKGVIEAFTQENPNIEVNLELAPFSQLMESIEIKLGAATSDVDVLFVDSPLVVNYSVKDYLEPLDNWLPADAKQKWTNSAVETVSYNGSLMAAPMNNSSQVLYYNKDILEAKGIALPAQNERLTWEQVVEMAKKLTYNDGEKQIYGFSFDRVDTSFQFLPLAQSLGATMLSEDGLTASGYTNSPEAIRAFQFYHDLFNTWGVSPKISQDESLNYFMSGNVALFAGLSHNVPKLVESGLNFGVTLFPYFEGGKIATPTGSWNIGISKYSEKKEAAAKFVEFLTLGKGVGIMVEKGGIFPVHVDPLNKIMTDPAYGEFPNVVTRIAAEESQTTAAPRPKTPGYLDWDTNVSKALGEIKNGADPKSTIDSAVQVIDNLLKKYAGL